MFGRSATRAFVAALGVMMLASTALATDIAPGKPAPDFTARDSKGREVTLSSLKGKVVVLEWTNNGCPYVGKHYGTGNMQALQSAAAAKDVVWLSIVSSAPGEQGHVTGPQADKVAADSNAKPASILLDPAGAIGRLYDARTTPHMFVIDRVGTLAYMGAIDDKPSANPADIKGARNFVSEAIDAVTAGKPVGIATTRPYGCSVKYSTARS